MKKFNWEKKGRVFNPLTVKGLSYLSEFAQAPSVVIFEDFVRIYFSCRPPADANGQYTSFSSFVDVEKNNLFSILRVSKEPILELGELGAFDEFGTYPVSVIQHENVFRAYYGGWTRCESVPFNVSIGVAESKNGEKFEKLGKGPVLPYSPDEPFILSGPKIRYFNDKFYLFYIAGREWVLDNQKPEPVYKIRMATSDDGIHWEKHNKDLIEDALGDLEAQASPDVIFKDGLYHMFFCYRQGTNYRNQSRGYRIGYAYSADLMHWQRNDDLSNLTVSESGWDSEMVSYPHVFELEGKTYMLYLGNQVGREGFGLAELIE